MTGRGNRAKKIIFAELILKFAHPSIKYDDNFSIARNNAITFDATVHNTEVFSVKFAFIVRKIDGLICKLDDSGGETMAGKIRMIIPIYNKTISRG